MDYQFSVIANLVYLLDGKGRVLLMMKRRGFGVGKWNGVGGKTQPGETVEQAARREVLEEVGVTVGALEPKGYLEFVAPMGGTWQNRCHLFLCREFKGVPRQTEEATPRWFPVAQLPWEQMWEDDKLWLPALLSGKDIYLRVFWSKQGKLIKWEDIPLEDRSPALTVIAN